MEEITNELKILEMLMQFVECVSSLLKFIILSDRVSKECKLIIKCEMKSN